MMTIDDAPLEPAPIRVDELIFPTGDVTLPALLHRGPAGPDRDLVIALPGAPGFPIGPGSPLADTLAPHGIDLLRFNYRGTWGRPGTFCVTESLADVRAAIDAATGRSAREGPGLRPARIHLVGHSYGGALALLAAMDDDRVAGAVSLAAPDFGYTAGEFLDPGSGARDRLHETAREARAMDFTSQDPSIYVDDIIANRERFAFVPRAAALLDRRLLLIAALDDEVCPPEQHVLPLYRTLRRLGHRRLEAEVLSSDHDVTGRWPEIFARVASWVVAGRGDTDAPDGRPG